MTVLSFLLWTVIETYSKKCAASLTYAADKCDHPLNVDTETVWKLHCWQRTGHNKQALRPRIRHEKHVLEDQTISALLLQSAWMERRAFLPMMENQQLLESDNDVDLFSSQQNLTHSSTLFFHPVLRRTQTQLLKLSPNARNEAMVNGVSRHLAENAMF